MRRGVGATVFALSLLTIAPACKDASTGASTASSASGSSGASNSSGRAATPKKPFDDACAKDDDCTAAPNGRGCCPAPCTSVAFNKKELSRADELACDPPQTNCPSAGGCLTHHTLCVDQKCKVVFSGQPGFREPK